MKNYNVRTLFSISSWHLYWVFKFFLPNQMIVSNGWITVVLLFCFGSYEQLWNNSHQNWWLSVCRKFFLCTIRDIIMHNVHTLVFSKFEIISKLSSVKSCAYLSDLPGTELKGSVVPFSESAWESAMCEMRGRILLFLFNIFYFSGIK